MGRPEFESVIAQISRETFKLITSNTSAIVPATSGSEVIQIFSAPNTISKVITLGASLPAPAGAASGTHYLKIMHNSGGGYIQAASNFGDAIAIDLMSFITATSTTNNIPVDKINQSQTMRSITFSDVYPLILNYINQTNAQQAGSRSITLNVIERQVGK